MPTPPNNPAVARCVIRYGRDTRIFENVIHVVRLDGAILGSADLQRIAQAVTGAWTSYNRALTPTQIKLLDITATKLDPSSPLQYTDYVNTAGTFAATAAPANVTIAVSERTGLAGRKYRGRVYLPIVQKDGVNLDDTATSAQILNAQNYVANIFNGWFTLTPIYLPCIFHRATNLQTVVNSITTDAPVDSQRRRLAGRGR